MFWKNSRSSGFRAAAWRTYTPYRPTPPPKTPPRAQTTPFVRQRRQPQRETAGKEGDKPKRTVRREQGETPEKAHTAAAAFAARAKPGNGRKSRRRTAAPRSTAKTVTAPRRGSRPSVPAAQKPRPSPVPEAETPQAPAAAPRRRLFGLASSGPKSVMAPTPMKIREG